MKKLKTALIFSSALLASSAVQAQWESNWLIGLSGGYAWHNDDNNFDFNIVDADGDTVSVFSNGNNWDGDNHHGIWGVFAGYQSRCNGWLAGVELAVDWLGHDDNDGNVFVFTDNLGQTWEGSFNNNHNDNAIVGLTARFGYEVAPFFMPYIRLGIEGSNRNHDSGFQAVTNPVVLVNGNVPLVVVASGDDDDGWNARFVGGLGFEVPITAMNGLSIRAEWNYHSKGGHDSDGIVALASDNGTVWTVSGNSESGFNTAKVSLVWNFI